MLPSFSSTKYATTIQREASTSLSRLTDGKHVASSIVAQGAADVQPTDARLMQLYNLGLRDLDWVREYDVSYAADWPGVIKVKVTYEIFQPSRHK